MRALNAYIKLMRAAESMTAKMDRRLKARGLTMSQFGVLEALFHLGPMCQRELGRKLLKSNGNITTVVENLERRELIHRVRGEEDRRFITVHLTTRGATMIERLFPEHLASIVDEMQALSSTDQEALGELCKRLGLAVETTDRRKRRAVPSAAS